MASSSRTVGSEVGALRAEIEQLRTLITEMLREILRISQTQAETGRVLTEAFTTMVQSTKIDGPGTSRTLSESDEYRQWRADLKERRG